MFANGIVYDFGRDISQILIDKNRIMNKQLETKVTENKPELYTVLCPVNLFRYFLRKQYKDIEISNEECDELNTEFHKYLTSLRLSEKQKENLMPKSEIDVIMNSEHPFRMHGFSPAYVFHFGEFIGKMKSEADNRA